MRRALECEGLPSLFKTLPECVNSKAAERFLPMPDVLDSKGMADAGESQTL